MEQNDMSSMWTAVSDLDYYSQFNPDPPEEEEPEPDEPEEDDEVEVIDEEAAMEALREEAGDRAYDQQEEDRLFPLGPLTIGPFEPPVPYMAPVAEGPRQGKLFKEVA
jgi:hypothetical protein